MYFLEVPDRVAQFTSFTSEVDLTSATNAPDGRRVNARGIYIDDISGGTTLTVRFTDGAERTMTVGAGREILGKFTAILNTTTVSRLTVSW